MTVSTEISREEYTGNGVTTDFDYRFRVFSADELVVSVADTTENISTLVLNTDYTVTGAGSRTGGKVKLVNPLANAWRISIERDLPVTQETDVRNQGNFFPEVHEDAWDKLTMLIQQAFNGLSLALKKPTWLAKYYDAKGNRIINLGSPINSQDAANKTYVDSSVAGSIGHADDLFKRTIRVPENYVEQLPTVAGRRGRLFAWDNVGRPIAVHAETDDGTQLEIDLAGADGLKYVGQCPNLATLRTIEPSYLGQQIFLKEHTLGSSQGGGAWYCHALTSDTSFIDDNGCQVIGIGGAVWRRKDLTAIFLDMFGAIGGSDIKVALDNAYRATRTFNIPEVVIPWPSNGKPYLSSGGNIFSLTDGKPFYLRGLSLASKGPVILHTGNNSCMEISKDFSAQEDFWISGGIEGISIFGWNTATNAYYNDGENAKGITVSDMWGAKIKNVFIMKYRNGDGIRLYNNTFFTEGTIIENAMVRDCLIGYSFQRNGSSSTATSSFFRTQMINCAYNAGINASNTAVKVGDGLNVCVVYGSSIEIAIWMSGGSWHSGIYIDSKSKMIDGEVTIISDGYGYEPGAVVEVIHLIYCKDRTAIYRCNTRNLSGQAGSGPSLDRLQILYNSLIYFDYSNPYTADDGRGYLQPKGASIRYSGQFTVSQQQSGTSYSLRNLMDGTVLGVRINSWTDKASPNIEDWVVVVRSVNQPCIVIPRFEFDDLVKTFGTAVTPGSNTDTFMKSAIINNGHRFWAGDSSRLNLTLRNYNNDNDPSFLVNSGHIIRFVLPSNNAATLPMTYAVDIEFL